MTPIVGVLVAIVALANIAGLVILLASLRRRAGEKASTTETSGHVWDEDLRELNNATLPDEYHWEGMQLDRDFADARRAAELDVRATLRTAGGVCQLTLQLDAPLPETLQLSLVHATRPDLDQQVPLSRVGQVYEGKCGPTTDGHWHVELADGRREWTVRRDWAGSLDGARLNAR